MHHDHQTLASPALFRPLNLNMDTVPQTDTRSPCQRCDQCAGTFPVPVPGGASILMKDSAGTSMALNVDIDPCSGTPVLSGRAISAQGEVLDVHPCGCNYPLTSRHNLPLPRSPLCRSGAHALDPSHLYPSPRSPPRRPSPIFTRTRTPLVLVQTRLPESPSAPESQLEPETLTPVPCADPLGSPFTPTPASMQRNSQASSGNTSFHTTQTCSGETSTHSAVPDPLETPREAKPPPSVPPRLDTLPPLSAFCPDLDDPLVQSPSSISQVSEISGPSTIGPLPSSPSYTASERSIHTVVPHTRPAENSLMVEEPTLPGRPEATMSSANNGAEGPHTQDVCVTSDGVVDSLDHGPTTHNTDTTSDLYTDHIIAGPPMPAARISSDCGELGFDLTTFEQTAELASASEMTVHHSGEIKGTWVANFKRDRMALKLDLSLDGLGFQNLSLSVPDPRPQASPSHLVTVPYDDLQVPPMRWTPAAADDEALVEQGPDPAIEPEPQNGWEVESNSSQSIMTFGSCPSTAPPLSDLPLTPIPELLHTPTKHSMSFTGTPDMGPAHPPSRTHAVELQHLASKLPTPLDNEHILAQLAQGENDIGSIRNALCELSNEWQNVVMMPDGVALRDVEDDCAALHHALVDLSPIIVLTWPPMRQPSMGTEGGQPPAQEQLLYLSHLGETERKWYLKQHEFTTSLQRNLTRLTLLAQRVREDPDAAYRGNALERISQFTTKFEDIALRLKLAHHVRVEQKYRARVRHSARRAVVSPEQAAAHEYHKAVLSKVREDIEAIKHGMRAVDGSRRDLRW